MRPKNYVRRSDAPRKNVAEEEKPVEPPDGKRTSFGGGSQTESALELKDNILDLSKKRLHDLGVEGVTNGRLDDIKLEERKKEVLTSSSSSPQSVASASPLTDSQGSKSPSPELRSPAPESRNKAESNPVNTSILRQNPRKLTSVVADLNANSNGQPRCEAPSQSFSTESVGISRLQMLAEVAQSKEHSVARIVKPADDSQNGTAQGTKDTVADSVPISDSPKRVKLLPGSTPAGDRRLLSEMSDLDLASTPLERPLRSMTLQPNLYNLEQLRGHPDSNPNPGIPQELYRPRGQELELTELQRSVPMTRLPLIPTPLRPYGPPTFSESSIQPSPMGPCDERFSFPRMIPGASPSAFSRTASHSPKIRAEGPELLLDMSKSSPTATGHFQPHPTNSHHREEELDADRGLQSDASDDAASPKAKTGKDAGHSAEGDKRSPGKRGASGSTKKEKGKKLVYLYNRSTLDMFEQGIYIFVIRHSRLR